MKLLIIEDEIPAHEKLRALIDAHIDSYEIVAWCRSISETNMILNKNPQIDLIFSDVELLDGTSFQIFEQHTINCPIIFCTAFDQYLFKAFQTNGIAYLLKPYTTQNFKEAIAKYKTLFSQKESEALHPDLIKQLKELVQDNHPIYKTRFSIKKKNGIKLLSIDEITSIEANGDFCFAFDTSGIKHVLNYSIGQVQDKLDPSLFFRINRSEIIHLPFIESIENHFKNKLAVKIKHRNNALFTSGSRTPEFRKWIG